MQEDFIVKAPVWRQPACSAGFLGDENGTEFMRKMIVSYGQNERKSLQ